MVVVHTSAGTLASFSAGGWETDLMGCLIVTNDAKAVATFASGRWDFVELEDAAPSLPPHFPQPNADPIAVLEAALAEKDEIIAAQYAELTGWRTQLEAALVRIAAMEAA